MKGKVGPHEIEWLSPIKGVTGDGRVRVTGGKEMSVAWKLDASGIVVYFDDQVLELDAHVIKEDDGTRAYDLWERHGAFSVEGAKFLREGQDALSGGGVAKKRAVKVKAQMPGKIIKLLVTKGQKVEKGTPLLVMEAMKMENEIKASDVGTIESVKISEGQSVESGAELMMIGPLK